MLPCEARVVTFPAGEENQASKAVRDEDPVRQQATEGDFVGAKADSPTHGLSDGLPLLVDLLVREVVLEFALHDRGDYDFERLVSMLRVAETWLSAWTSSSLRG